MAGAGRADQGEGVRVIINYGNLALGVLCWFVLSVVVAGMYVLALEWRWARDSDDWRGGK